MCCKKNEKMSTLTKFGFVILCVASTVLCQKPVTVLKCCPDGESLTKKLKCEKSAKEWKPTIVSNNLKLVLPAGEIPTHWDVIDGEPKCEVKELITKPSFLLIENGSLWRESNLMNPGQFCADTNAAIICLEKEDVKTGRDDVPSEQKKKINVKKCCGGHAVYSEQISSCVYEDRSKKDVTITSFLQNTTSLNVLNVNYTYLTFGFPSCEEGYITVGKLSEDGTILQQDGSLNIPLAKVNLLAKTFCLEYVQGYAKDHPTIFTCPNYIPVLNQSYQDIEHNNDWRFTIFPIGLFISVLFLTATLVAGCLLPSTHHMLHWKCQTYHVICLLVGDLLLAVTQLIGNLPSLELCMALAVSMHFFFLAAFFWLNTMCFNIWWTFRDLRPASLDKNQEAWRLRIYQLYAWGAPTIIAGIAIVFDNVPEENFPSVLRPKFAQKRCWFYGDMEILTYFFGPIGVLLFLNLILFGLTARELTCGLWKREVVKSTSERATLGRVCLKLVVVMGITWIADVASWAVGGPEYLWYITDVINSLQGVLIFIVVGCQPQIWSAVKRIWCVKESTTTSANGNHPVSSSQDVPSINESSTNTQNTTIKSTPAETIC